MYSGNVTRRNPYLFVRSLAGVYLIMATEDWPTALCVRNNVPGQPDSVWDLEWKPVTLPNDKARSSWAGRIWLVGGVDF